MHNPTFLNNWYYLPTWNNDVADWWLGMSDMALTWHRLDTHVVGRRHGKHDMDTAWQSHDVAWMTWKLHGRHVANYCTWLTLHNEWTCSNCCIVWTHSKPFPNFGTYFLQGNWVCLSPKERFLYRLFENWWISPPNSGCYATPWCYFEIVHWARSPTLISPKWQLPLFNSNNI